LAGIFDDHRAWLRQGDDEDWSLEVVLSKPTETFIQGKDQKAEVDKSLTTPKEEQALMAELLYKFFCWDPKKRLTSEEVLEHRWFKM
jgi:hypothetical protein